MNSVKNAHNVAAAIADPPGIHPTSARRSRSRRSEALPSASRNPASVKSGIAARPLDVVNCSAPRMASTAGPLPSVSDAKIAMPPSSTKIGAPMTAATTTAVSHGHIDAPRNASVY